MTATTELYHRWFGIDPSEMPTNAYRLLDVAVFESDLDVIDDAARQRIKYANEMLSQEPPGVSTEILDELRQIQSCLLDPELKSTYDEQLREYLKLKQTVVLHLGESQSKSDDDEQSITDDELEPLTHFEAPVETPSASALIPIPSHSATDKAKRRQNGGKNFGIEMVKVVIGGAVGLGLGFLLLSYFDADNDLFRSLGIQPRAKPADNGPVDNSSTPPEVKVIRNENPSSLPGNNDNPIESKQQVQQTMKEESPFNNVVDTVP